MSLASDAVATRFANLFARLDPPAAALTTAVDRTTGIVARLAARDIAVSRSARVGSFYKKTAIVGTSDLDLFVVLRRESVRWAGSYVSSMTVLNNVREAIIGRYPRSEVGRDGSAVTVSFATGVPIDVVPAVFEKPLNTGQPLYRIPDGEGDWLLTSPDAQLKSFQLANLRAGQKLRRCVQAVKHWATARAVPLPISSYYIEAVLASSDVAVGVRAYSDVVADSFILLANRGTAALQDPLGISGYIAPARTRAQRETIAKALDYAAEHAAAAFNAELARDGREAVRQWRMVLPAIRPL